MKTDSRVDAYIQNAAEFARPVLRHLRALVHRACPEVEETIKWGMPYFMHRGILCGIAAFNHHATFTLWKGDVLMERPATGAMGHFGRITSVSDLPADEEILALLRKAAELNERGEGRRERGGGKSKQPTVSTPKDLAAALQANPKARRQFAGFTPSHQREYVNWLTEAKREATRQKRLATALAWISAGKPSVSPRKTAVPLNRRG